MRYGSPAMFRNKLAFSFCPDPVVELCSVTSQLVLFHAGRSHSHCTGSGRRMGSAQLWSLGWGKSFFCSLCFTSQRTLQEITIGTMVSVLVCKPDLSPGYVMWLAEVTWLSSVVLVVTIDGFCCLNGMQDHFFILIHISSLSFTLIRYTLQKYLFICIIVTHIIVLKWESINANV